MERRGRAFFESPPDPVNRLLQRKPRVKVPDDRLGTTFYVVKVVGDRSGTPFYEVKRCGRLLIRDFRRGEKS